MKVQLFNRGKRQIHGQTHVERNEDGTFKLDADGNEIKPVDYVFMPGKALEFHEVDAAKLRRLFKGEVVSFDDLKQQFDGSKPADQSPPPNVQMHHNLAPQPSMGDLSPEEQAAIALMRTQKAVAPVQPVDPNAPVVEPVDIQVDEPTEKERKSMFAGLKDKLSGGA